MAARKKATRSNDPPVIQPGSEAAGAEPPPPVPSRAPIVGIGASAGGLEALTALLRALPDNTGMAFILVQHLDPTHESMLCEILSRATRMPVIQVAEGMAAQPNHVYVTPPAAQLEIAHAVLHIIPRGETPGSHRPIDHFLRALAEDQGFRAIGVILSGGGTDGTLGLEAVKAEGGITFAQDDSAQHTSMPNSAVASGCVDFVMAPASIAAELARIGHHPYVARAPEEVVGARGGEASLDRVLEQLRLASGVDFTSYKRSTLFRRITRRAVLHKLDDLREYSRLLRSDPGEVEALYRDVLINVTSFFRNPDAFEVLKSKVFPRLVKDRSRHDPLRVWSVGCSTGEEAYSIAIAFAEFADLARIQVPLQVFATDLNGSGVEKARAGLYSKVIARDVSPDRLRRFFFESDGTYRISKGIRDTAVFARHNILTEPPFSRIDLVSCRNLMIYLEPALQQKAMGMMHYALKPQGVLWLGNSETIGGYRDLFEVEDAKQKMYVKKPGPPRLGSRPFSRDPLPGRRSEAPLEEIGPTASDVHREADRLLLAKYTPPSVLVNGDLEVLQFRGDTGLYLAPSPGRASLHLLKLLRDGLVVGVRGALLRARREETPVREEGLRVRSNGGYRQVNVHVIPVRGTPPTAEPHFLVLFEDVRTDGGDPRVEKPEDGPTETARAADQRAQEATEREATRLGQELAATREYLQSVIEQQEAVNEELQSSNEEVQSANEELQSINEEMETSKEEVQSANEELATLNEELQNRNAELGQTNNDFTNLLASVQLPIIMLGSDLRIRRFTVMAERLLNLIGTDVGRPISDIRLGVGVPDLEQMLLEVMDTVAVKEVEVRDRQGRWYMLRVRPYRTQENRIDGVVLVFIDVDAIKQTQETLRRQGALLDQVEEAIFMWHLDGGITYWNRGAEETYGLTRAQALGRKPHELLASSPPPQVFLEALQARGQWTGELTQTRADGTTVVVESRMTLERGGDGGALVFESNNPLTERKRMEESLRSQTRALLAADRSKDEFLAILAHELRNPLAPLANALEVVKTPGVSPEVSGRARDIMTNQIWNMSRLVDDLLDVARVSQGRILLRKEVRDLVGIVRQAIEVNRHLIAAREQEIAVALPPGTVMAEVDPLRLEQAVGNLLNNASKFSGRGGHIEVVMTDRSAEAADVEVRVKDDGIGISAGALEHVFDMFMQEESSISRSTGGLGIGLTLVRHLAGLHGGTVEARSEGPGRGSEFVLRIPVPPLQSGAATAAEPGRSAGSRGRPILVTDDNVDGAEALAIVLRMVGHQVRVAHSGPDALEIAGAFQPEVIFLDLGMPGMDGFETARQLRQIPGLERALLVAMTGYGQDASRERAHAVGIDEYLVKPAQPAVVRSLAQRTRSTPERTPDA
jgi:two-component system CheB/CheR fusion protein